MAKVIVAGNAVVINSAVKLEDLKLVSRYRSEALVVKDEEGDPVFSVGVGTKGSISKYGVEFAEESRDEHKYATMTLVLDIPEGKEIKEEIADKFGGSLILLEKVEEGLPAVIRAIKAERAAIIDNIEIAG